MVNMMSAARSSMKSDSSAMPIWSEEDFNTYFDIFNAVLQPYTVTG